MSILANKTERAAIKALASTLKYFGCLAQLNMTAEDAFTAKAAENHIRSIIETNGYKVDYKIGRRASITKTKN